MNAFVLVVAMLLLFIGVRPPASLSQKNISSADGIRYSDPAPDPTRKDRFGLIVTVALGCSKIDCAQPEFPLICAHLMSSSVGGDI